jgi:hypothetical protein
MLGFGSKNKSSNSCERKKSSLIDSGTDNGSGFHHHPGLINKSVSDVRLG